MKTLCTVLVLLLPMTATTAFHLGHNRGEQQPQPHEVRICQNKDCCRQWTLAQNLPETVQDLLPPDAAPVQVQATGCLSQCGKGPNLTMQNNNNNQNGLASSSQQVMLHAVQGPMALAAELQEQLGIRVPSKLLASVTVMDKARKGTCELKDNFCACSLLACTATILESPACFIKP